MRASTHLAFAMALAVPSVGHLCGLGSGCGLPLLYWYAAGALFPDIDEPRSYMGRRLWFLSWPIRFFTAHRETTHSFLFVLPFAALLYALLVPFGMSAPMAVAFAAGNVAHVLGDMATKGGCPVFYPVSERRYHLLPPLLRFRTGSLAENLWMLFFVAIALWPWLPRLRILFADTL